MPEDLDSFLGSFALVIQHWSQNHVWVSWSFKSSPSNSCSFPTTTTSTATQACYILNIQTMLYSSHGCQDQKHDEQHGCSTSRYQIDIGQVATPSAPTLTTQVATTTPSVCWVNEGDTRCYRESRDKTETETELGMRIEVEIEMEMDPDIVYWIWLR